MRKPVSLAVLLVIGMCFAGCKQPATPPANSASQGKQGPPVVNGITAPKLITRVHADFPQSLWDKPGTVSVGILIKTYGTVGDAKVLSSPHPELNQYALDAVKQWKFEPAQKDGKPVPLSVTVNVQFTPPSPQQPGSAQGSNPAKPKK